MGRSADVRWVAGQRSSSTQQRAPIRSRMAPAAPRCPWVEAPPSTHHGRGNTADPETVPPDLTNHSALESERIGIFPTPGELLVETDRDRMDVPGAVGHGLTTSRLFTGDQVSSTHTSAEGR
jgi:hypothetical protein